jgi:hypothetical protein
VRHSLEGHKARKQEDWMSETLAFAACAVIIGAAATIIMDVWTLALKYIFRAKTLDYALVGRWVIYMLRGRFRHRPISATPAAKAERAVGWMTHYLTGIAFAVLLLGVFGLGWVREPSLAPALTVGLGTVIVPFLVMQPAMGAGIVARHMPHPHRAQLKSLMTHTIFGLGLYAGGRLASLLPI